MLQALADFSHALQASSRYSEIISSMAELLPALLGASSGALYLNQGSPHPLRRAFAWGPERYLLEMAADDCWAVRLKEAYRQPAKPGVASCKHLLAIRPFPHHDSRCFPLVAAGDLRGMLVVADTPVPDLPPGEGDAFRRRVLGQVATTLDQLHRLARLEDESVLDALTGLSNRRFLEAVLPREIVRATRRQDANGQQGVALLVMGVDDLKGINQHHGRAQGDSVLRVVARALQQQTRASDVAARVGGNAFAVVLTDINPFLALARGNALRKSLEQLSVPAAGIVCGQITGCFGVAHYPYHGVAAGPLFKTALQALARAREDGGNCVVFGD